MLRDPFDRAAVRHGIGFGEVLHGLYQHFLAVHVAGIRSSFAPLRSLSFRSNRDRKNLGHVGQNFRVVSSILVLYFIWDCPAASITRTNPISSPKIWLPNPVHLSNRSGFQTTI